ncbi:hypothetical protein F4805DRAFT_434939 [Annulohypoxylon moriforme]|nr:hypothetical protein F4805DRAFT_434939 [Annulohypoxylon moriforme]
MEANMAAPMKKIPLEVLRMILNRVSKRDLQTLRLVSPLLNHEASTILFRRVFASAHEKDLDVLSAIANHPTLCRHPREIVYAGVFFSKEHPDEKDLKDPQYQNGLKKQNRMIESGLDVDIITSALVKLPSIRKVTFTNHWCRKFSNPPLTKDYPTCHMRPAGNLASADKSEILFDHGFKVMCRALSISGHKVEELLVHYFSGKDDGQHDYTEPWNSGLYFRSLPHGDGEIERACNVFRNMKKIELSLTYTDDSHLDEFWEDRCAGLAKALGAATELRELTLNFNHESLEDIWPNFTDNKLPLTAAITAHPLPRLHTLRIRRKYMQQEELIALLKPLCGTLQTLELTSIYLINGSWRETAMELHKLEWRGLERTEFYNLREGYGDNSPEKGEDYEDGYVGWDGPHDYDSRKDCVNCLGVEDCMRDGDPNLISKVDTDSVKEPQSRPTDDWCEFCCDFDYDAWITYKE